MSMQIKILAKGLSLTYINLLGESNNYFIPYNNIIEVGPIELSLDKSNYNFCTEKYFGEYIRKLAYFRIKTANDSYIIYIPEDAKQFPRTNKNESIWKKIFFKLTDENGLSRDARFFAAFEKCEEAVKHITELRNKVIEAINKEK